MALWRDRCAFRSRFGRGRRLFQPHGRGIHRPARQQCFGLHSQRLVFRHAFRKQDHRRHPSPRRLPPPHTPTHTHRHTHPHTPRIHTPTRTPTTITTTNITTLSLSSVSVGPWFTGLQEQPHSSSTWLFNRFILQSRHPRSAAAAARRRLPAVCITLGCLP